MNNQHDLSGARRGGLLAIIAEQQTVNAESQATVGDWTFSTPTHRFFPRRGRNKELVDELLGEDFGGVLVGDFFRAYAHYSGLHRRCWPHLLRDIHSLKATYPDDASLAGWAKAVQDLATARRRFLGRILAVADRRLEIARHHRRCTRGCRARETDQGGGVARPPLAAGHRAQA